MESPNLRDTSKPSGLRDIVRTTIQKRKLITPGDKVIVGVSGGADSLALLHCLRALREELQITLHVAHLNHQLRGAESDADVEFVTALAREWKLPATIEARDVGTLARAEHLSIEEVARRARYVFLTEVARRENARVIAVAHHKDDQVETVLMHLLRGAGLAGLRGMKYKMELRGNEFGVTDSDATTFKPYLIRPLLDARRTEIETYCKENYLAPRLDRSNLDTLFFRNRLRHEVLPYLETINPNIREVLYHSAAAIADDYDLLTAYIEAAYAEVATEEHGAIVFNRHAWRALHPALQRGTMRAAIQQLRSELRNIGWVHIEDARQIALEKNAGTSASLPQGLMLVVGYGNFIIADAAHGLPMPDMPLLLHAKHLEIPLQGVVELPDTNWVIETQVADKEPESSDRWTAVLDLAMCRGERALRRRKPGDRFEPAGMGGHSRSLHEFMIDEKIERAVRALLPLLVVGDRIVWVCGWRTDERARVMPWTREFWRVTFRKKEPV